MPKGLTNEQIEQVSKNEVKTRNLIDITISDDVHVRILENDTLTTLTIGDDVYFAGMVKRGELQTTNQNETEKIEITISNIWQEISGIIANEGDVLTGKDCKILEVIYDAEKNIIIDDPILIFQGAVDTLQVTASTFVFNVTRSMGGYETVSPNATYDVNCQCKRFKDERCCYSGSETKCDKTLSRCIELGNYINFYGFPTIPQNMVIRN